MKKKMLNWAQQFSIFCFLDNHQYHTEPHTLECLLGAGAKRSITGNKGRALQQLQHFIEEKPGFLLGHLSYDLKDEIIALTSTHRDYIQFPALFFFEPEFLLRLQEGSLEIEAEKPAAVYDAILATPVERPVKRNSLPPIQSRLSREAYIDIVQQLRRHILRGDCYEINFCQEFFAEPAEIDPLSVFEKLSALSPNPFSAFYRTGDQYLLCASPERFLKKKDRTILSQPIKGTAKRNTHNREEEEQDKMNLYLSEKDRSENVMVVDLVRNDLSRICREGSVKVDELYGIYSFPQVYQMISTVSGELAEGLSFTDIIRATFPMGSMTGAPKRSVLQLIEQYEPSHRGLFSGALGYITPAGDFDFNVVIRSILYNAGSSYLSFQAGSGITFYSDPVGEWEECQLKAAAIKKVLTVENE